MYFGWTSITMKAMCKCNWLDHDSAPPHDEAGLYLLGVVSFEFQSWTNPVLQPNFSIKIYKNSDIYIPSIPSL